MATSGTSVWNESCVDIITDALLDVGAIDENDIITATQYEKGLSQLNALTKEWMATGIHVWTEEEAVLFFQQGQVRYLLGGATLDHVADANAWIQGQLLVPAAAGANSVQLQTTVGISSGDQFGVCLDSGFTFWTTVNGAPAGNVVTMTAPLPSTASGQNFTFSYTTNIVRPLRVPRARLLYYQGLIENPMTVLSRKEYMDLPNKHSPGTPTQFFYSPQLVSGELYIWPQPITAAYGCRFTWYRPIMDFNNPGDTPDMPQEWINALRWNLARELGPSYTIPEQQWQRIVSMADAKLNLVADYDRESEPIQFGLGVDESQAWGQR